MVCQKFLLRAPSARFMDVVANGADRGPVTLMVSMLSYQAVEVAFLNMRGSDLLKQGPGAVDVTGCARMLGPTLRRRLRHPRSPRLR